MSGGWLKYDFDGRDTADCFVHAIHRAVAESVEREMGSHESRPTSQSSCRETDPVFAVRAAFGALALRSHHG